MKQYISSALRESFVKLRPASMFRNPVMFTVYLCTIIMLFVWGFSSGTNPSKQNFCRAALILYAICFVLFFLFGGMAFLGAMRGMPQGT